MSEEWTLMGKVPVPELTEEQQHMQVVADVANKLVRENEDFSQIIAAMLASRQLYAMCLYELERLCAATDFKKLVKPEESGFIGLTDRQQGMLKEILVNAAATKAQEPFDENDLFKGMVETVFPWMQKVVAKHNELQAAQREKQFEEQEAQRLATSLNLGFQIFPGCVDLETHSIGRHKPLLLVGWQPAVQFVLDYIVKWADDPEKSNVYQTVRLNINPPQYTNSRFVHVRKKAWENVAGSVAGFQRLYEAGILPELTAPVDLLVVDDLLHAKEGASFISAQSRANESQKRLKRWAEKAGCLLVSGLPLKQDLEPNALNKPEYETLRMHNVLRAVTTEKKIIDGENYFEISVGMFLVAKVLEADFYACLEKKIIQP